MRPRTAGKIVMAALTVVLALLALNYINKVGAGDKLYQGFRAVAFAILSLSSATFYRYFED